MSRTHGAAKSNSSNRETAEQIPSRKRPRCKSLECIDDTNSRDTTRCQTLESYDLKNTVMLQEKVIRNLMGRVSALEQRIRLIDQVPTIPRVEHVEVRDYTPNDDSAGKYICPIENCRRAFRRADNLSRHILGSKSLEHKGIASNLNQNFCVPCQKHFNRPSDFSRHEKNNHEELYKARLNWLEKSSADENVTQISMSPSQAFFGKKLKRRTSNYLQSFSSSSSSKNLGNTRASQDRAINCSQNPLKSPSQASFGYDAFHIDLAPSNFGGEKDSGNSIGTITQPGISVANKDDADYNNMPDTIQVGTRDPDTLASAEGGLNKEALSDESTLLPECFYDAGPYDIPAFLDDDLTAYPKSLDKACDSPFLPPIFFDIGPYDLHSSPENGYGSNTETNNASTDGSCLPLSLLDFRIYDTGSMPSK